MSGVGFVPSIQMYSALYGTDITFCSGATPVVAQSDLDGTHGTPQAEAFGPMGRLNLGHFQAVARM